ncbi:LysR family transcriptional regulator [Aneurinibacillus migulanus]|nr:LysR family transcriptional regulator [Aneurinibacillus migulanus]KIV58062.1 LysR family transcriptional regulator [Aneurinibacillus migulanus]KPD06279.1 LysR family transcriptional regulator [Aneurinibacillus migulanus]MCP1355853.1 LysR family transcriptional regulator [Aneurinibacillus migulanus]CEH28536.1 Transcriptional regulator [Aneurinibacillus migulanus]
MTLAKFEVFRTVIELGGLSKAAEALGLTQSAVSHAIASLESDFGFTLLTRGRSGISLTSNGERILLYIHEILKWNEQMMQEVANINGIEVGTVRIGTFPSVSIQWLPQIMKQFKQSFPLIEIKLFEGNYDDIEQWIVNGAVDFGFLSLPTSKAFEVIPLKKDKMLCILPDTHPLHQQDKIYFEQIKNEMFIMPKSNIDKDVRKILKNNNVTPEIQYEVEEDQAIIAMVQNNLGISILPEMILYRIPNNVCVINLEGDNYRSIGIAATSLKNISPAAGKFIEYVKLWLNVQE